MIEELARVLDYDKFQPRLEQLGLSSADLLAYAMDVASVFDVPQNGPIIVAADPDHDILLRCALGAQARYVVSGDRHLLDLGDYAGIAILTVERFLHEQFPERYP